MHALRSLCRRHQILSYTFQKSFFNTSSVLAGTTPGQLKEQQSAAAKKGARITKIIKLAHGAVNVGGGSADPSSNKKLAEILDLALKEGISKSKVLNAISTKSEKKPVHTFFITTPDGLALVVDCHAKSPAHARSTLKSCLKKSLFNGVITDQKLIDNFFNKKGVILVSEPLKDGKELTEDQRTELALDVDAEDVIQVDEDLKFICSPSSLKSSVQALEEMSFSVVYSSVDYVATNPGHLSEDNRQFYEYFLKLVSDVAATPQKSCELYVTANNLE